MEHLVVTPEAKAFSSPNPHEVRQLTGMTNPQITLASKASTAFSSEQNVRKTISHQHSDIKAQHGSQVTPIKNSYRRNTGTSSHAITPLSNIKSEYHDEPETIAGPSNCFDGGLDDAALSQMMDDLENNTVVGRSSLTANFGGESPDSARRRLIFEEESPASVQSQASCQLDDMALSQLMDQLEENPVFKKRMECNKSKSDNIQEGAQLKPPHRQRRLEQTVVTPETKVYSSPHPNSDRQRTKNPYATPFATQTRIEIFYDASPVTNRHAAGNGKVSKEVRTKEDSDRSKHESQATPLHVSADPIGSKRASESFQETKQGPPNELDRSLDDIRLSRTMNDFEPDKLSVRSKRIKLEDEKQDGSRRGLKAEGTACAIV